MHSNYKDMVLKATDVSTVVTGRRFNASACRCLKSSFSREYLKLEYAADTTAEMMEQYGVGAFRKAAEEGNVAEGCFFCGQIAGMVSKIQPAAEIIAEVMADAEKLMKGSVIWEK